MAFKIYTKTGDKGHTSLIGGTKVPKSHTRIEAYGTVDELNSYLGLCCDLITDESQVKLLKHVQDRLFAMGSTLACDPQKQTGMHIPHVTTEDIKMLEDAIDQMNDQLPEMKNFILPGGHPVVSHIHIARCICRRTERCCVRLAEESEVESIIIIYLNRLSDYLFMLARFTGMQLNVAEHPWRPA